MPLLLTISSVYAVDNNLHLWALGAVALCFGRDTIVVTTACVPLTTQSGWYISGTPQGEVEGIVRVHASIYRVPSFATPLSFCCNRQSRSTKGIAALLAVVTTKNADCRERLVVVVITASRQFWPRLPRAPHRAPSCTMVQSFIPSPLQLFTRCLMNCSFCAP